jgi:hypothetical protein
MKTSAGKRLIYKNEWEADSYYIGGVPVSPTKVQIRGKEYKVTAQVVSVPYDDMGHTYSGVSTHYFVEEAVFGRKRKFDLNTIVPYIPVFAVEYAEYK